MQQHTFAFKHASSYGIEGANFRMSVIAFIRVLTASWRPIPGVAIFFWMLKIAGIPFGFFVLVSLTVALVVMATYSMFRLVQAVIPWDSLFFFRFGHALLDLCGHLPRVFCCPVATEPLP